MELEAESEAMFGGEIEVDESYFGGKRKGKRGRGGALLEKSQYLACLSGEERFIPRSFQMPQGPR